MTDRANLANHTDAATRAWTSIPLPANVTSVPDDPFSGMAVRTITNAPPQLLAHILRTKANKGVEVLSPRATPMLATVERIDPRVRQPDHIVVTTQASANTGWPTSDGRDISYLFPGIPNKADGADAPQVIRTKTRPIGKSKTVGAPTDPVSKAIVASAAVIDTQRRADVGGDADVLAEVLDVAWSLPLGTFSTLAPVMLSSSQDLLRTAISSDHNAPDALLPIHGKKVIHVAGGTISRHSYGADVAMDWSRQRAVARAIFNLSCNLEGVNLLPTNRTYAAADMRAPIHSTERDKFLVFQPAYGSGFDVGAGGFRFVRSAKPPDRFALCTGTNPPAIIATEMELEATMSEMVTAGLPRIAAVTVTEAFRAGKVRVMVAGDNVAEEALVRGSNAAAATAPRRGALMIAGTEVVAHLQTRLARGAAPANVIRSRIYHLMQSSDAAELQPIYRTLATLKKEKEIYGIPEKPYSLIRQVSSRLAHTLGSIVIRSLALEAERVGSDLDEWYTLARAVIPKQLWSEKQDAVAWATVAVWGMWSGATGKWSGALRSASHTVLVKLSKATMRPRWLSVRPGDPDSPERAAKVVLRACQDLYGPYYECMYDYYALVSSNSSRMVPLGVGKRNIPFRVSEERRVTSLAGYLGACMWQLRGRILRSANVVRIPLGSPLKETYMAVVSCVDYQLAVQMAPNKAYEAMRQSYAALAKASDPALPRGAKGNILELLRSLPAPVFDGFEDICDGEFELSRLARYVMNPAKLADDIEKTFDEVGQELALAATKMVTMGLGPRPDAAAGVVATLRTAADAPVNRPGMEAAATEAIEDALGAMLEPRLISNARDAPAEVAAVQEEAMALVAAYERAEEPVQGKTGWVWARQMYGQEMTDVVLGLEEDGTEEQVEALLNTRYASIEEFGAALDSFYGEVDGGQEVEGDERGALVL